MKKTLYFEGAGCVPCNDVENCRIRTAFTNIEGKKIYIEFLSGYKHTRQKNGKIVSEPGYLFCDACFYITDDPEIDDCNKSRLSRKRREKVEELKKEFCALFNQKYDNTSYYIENGELVARIGVSDKVLQESGWTKGRKFVVEV